MSEATHLKKVKTKHDQEVRNLVKEVTTSERESAIELILKSIKINPIEILQLNVLSYNEKDIKKQYKKLSLLVHPDRCPESLKSDAQRAFGKLAEAKNQISNKLFRNKLNVQILEAKRRCQQRIKDKKLQDYILGKNNDLNNSNKISGKKRKREDDDNNNNLLPPSKKQRLNDNSTNGNNRNNININNINININNIINIININNINNEQEEKDRKSQIEEEEEDDIIVGEKELLEELHEILIDEAWGKHIETKASQKIENQQNAYREELKANIKAEKLRQENWNKSRGQRVNSWNNWKTTKKTKSKKNKDGKKKKKKLKKTGRVKKKNGL